MPLRFFSPPSSFAFAFRFAAGFAWSSRFFAAAFFGGASFFAFAFGRGGSSAKSASVPIGCFDVDASAAFFRFAAGFARWSRTLQIEMSTTGARSPSKRYGLS